MNYNIDTIDLINCPIRLTMGVKHIIRAYMKHLACKKLKEVDSKYWNNTIHVAAQALINEYDSSFEGFLEDKPRIMRYMKRYVRQGMYTQTAAGLGSRWRSLCATIRQHLGLAIFDPRRFVFVGEDESE